MAAVRKDRELAGGAGQTAGSFLKCLDPGTPKICRNSQIPIDTCCRLVIKPVIGRINRVMKNICHLLGVFVASLVCILPAVHSRADTIYVGSAHMTAPSGNMPPTAPARFLPGPPWATRKARPLIRRAIFMWPMRTYNTITKFTTNGASSFFAIDPGDNSILNYPEGPGVRPGGQPLCGQRKQQQH